MKAAKVGKAVTAAGPDASIVTPLIGTALMVFVGQWVKEDKVSMRTFFGVGVLIIFMAVAQDVNMKIAQQFAWLIFVTAILIYGVPVGKRIANLK